MVSTRAQRQELNIESIQYNGLTWVSIERPSLAEMDWLRDRYPFHPLDLDDCLSKVQLPKLDEYERYLFLVLHFPLFNERTRLTQRSEVDLFVGAGYVVTVHEGDLRPLVKLFRDCQASEEVRRDVMGKSSGQLLYRILDGLVDHCFPILRKVIENVNDVEERVFDEKAREMIREISLVRRDIISYRRIVKPQVSVLEALEQKEYPLLKVDPDVYFGDLADHTRHIWEQLEELKEVVEGLGDAYNSVTSHQTGEVMRVLTIIATIMLPLSVVSGLYGMNVRLPLESSSFAFGAVLGVMALITAAMLAFFRSRHWI